MYTLVSQPIRFTTYTATTTAYTVYTAYTIVLVDSKDHRHIVIGLM